MAYGYDLRNDPDVAKLLQLIADAKAKYDDAPADGDPAIYWAGVMVGLKRALNVIEGKG